MAELSGPAEAVLNAYCYNPNRINSDWAALADALRAAANQSASIIAIADEIERYGI